MKKQAVIVLVQGNTLKKLKELESDSIDLGITSPPYNKCNNNGWLVKKVKYESHADNMNEDDYQEDQIQVLNELYRVIKPGGSFFYNHKLRWAKGELLHPFNWLNKTSWTIKQEIIWNRKITGNVRGWRFWGIDERIYWLYKPIGTNKIGKELKSKHALLSSIWEIRPENNNPHPAPFPIDIPARIIYSIMDDEDGIVIDPYSGSGTTLVAAKLLGKKYVGIELSKEYIKMATQRINKPWDKDIERLEAEKDLHKVVKTFKQRKAEGMWEKKTK